MKFIKAKYLLSGLASLLLATSCTEDFNVLVPEYTKFENPEWTVAAGPGPATAPTDWTVEFGGGIENPEWKKVEAEPASRPTTWTLPDMNVYPASMTAVIRMSDYIHPSITSKDMLAAFVGTECRGIGQQIKDASGEILYLIQIKGDQSETGQVTFRYFCDATKELFHTGDAIAFEADATLGNVETPKKLTWNSESDLPYYMDFQIHVDLSSFDQGAVSEKDYVAAFVGNECRGVVAAAEEDGGYVFNLRAWARTADEQITLKYYSAELKDVYVYGVTYPVKHTGLEQVAMKLSEQGYMDMYVTVPEALRPYVSEKDNVAAYVNGYPCSIVQDTLNAQYLVKMKGSAGDRVSFRYYCDKLQYIFETEPCVTYTDAGSWGSASDYQVLPLNVNQKLLHMNAVFTVDEYVAINTELAEGDIMAAFVNGECRGVATGKLVQGKLVFEMDVLGTLGLNEAFELEYYHIANKYRFTCPRKFDFVPGGTLGTVYEPQGIIMNVVDNKQNEE